jgi:hypothetical protein
MTIVVSEQVLSDNEDWLLVEVYSLLGRSAV